MLSTNVCFKTELSLTKCSRSNKNIRFIDLNSILLRRIVLDICVIENNFQNRFSKIQMQQQMNNIQKMNNEKNKDKKKTNKQTGTKTKQNSQRFFYCCHPSLSHL